MKTLKFLTGLVIMSTLVFTSCQDEISDEIGEDPNTNSASSQTAKNLQRAAMYDGSSDDFLDNTSCFSVLFPVTATINDTQVTLVSESDYDLVLSIIGEFNDDDDSVNFQFPLTVRLSNYTDVQVTSQAEFDALMDACQQAENEAEDAINCIDINFPITILSYDVNSNQTGSVVIESNQQLYTYMNNLNDTDFFTVNYPISATLNGDALIEITSDLSLESRISECLLNEELMDEAEENAETLEDILVAGLFRVDTFVNSGVDTANTYADFTINFANDLTVTAENTVDATADDIQGTYEVASQFEVLLSLSFTGDATFELLNNTWEVTSYSETTIALQSTTNTAVTLVLTQI